MGVPVDRISRIINGVRLARVLGASLSPVGRCNDPQRIPDDSDTLLYNANLVYKTE